MRVAVISHAYQDQRYLATLEAMAHSADVQIALIHPARFKGITCCWKICGSVEDVLVSVVFGSRQGAFLYHPFALTAALNQLEPDLILHEQEVYALNAAQIAWVTRRRSIPLVQFVWENVDRSLAWPRRLVRSYVLRTATALLAGSEGAKWMHRAWGFRGLIESAPQMSVDIASNPRFGRRGQLVLKIAYVGRLVACKGVDCLLRAIDLLHRRSIQAELAIAGEGPERGRLIALARELGIWSMVHFRGQLQAGDVRQLLQSSDVLVLPSRRTPQWEEQFGLVLAEAMAQATIPVGSRTGAIPGVLGIDELLFAENDAQDLATILQRLATDPEFFLCNQQLVWRRAHDRFAADVVSRQKLDILRRVVEQVRTTKRAAGPGRRALPTGAH
jgi:glycosyltransferase involved in cell wall biosynthesis